MAVQILLSIAICATSFPKGSIESYLPSNRIPGQKHHEWLVPEHVWYRQDCTFELVAWSVPKKLHDGNGRSVFFLAQSRASEMKAQLLPPLIYADGMGLLILTGWTCGMCLKRPNLKSQLLSYFSDFFIILTNLPLWNLGNVEDTSTEAGSTTFEVINFKTNNPGIKLKQKL